MGKAQVTIRLVGWPEGHVAASHHEIEVVAPRRVVFEHVSSRLKDSLIFPGKKSSLVGLRYSPDGRRIIAGDYPGGVVQVWDARNGKQLVKIETGFGYHASVNYFLLSPDWKTLYSYRGKLTAPVVEKDHKRSNRYAADGDVRAWDMDTGEVRSTFKHDPPRAIGRMLLSPDGLSFVTFEDYYAESGRRLQSGTLWDVRSKQHRPLPADFQDFPFYSPDGQKLATTVQTKAGRAAVKVLEPATAQVRQQVSLAEKDCWILVFGCSPDGRLLIGDKTSRSDKQPWLTFWDASTGRELASFAAAKSDMFSWRAFSPDGRTVAVANRGGFQGRSGKLFLFDLPGRRLVAEIPLGEKTFVGEPVFSPDSKWIAVPTQAWSDGPPRGKAEPEDLPQPRIALVDSAAGAVRETLVAPPGLAGCACFSPDGKTLATSGVGKVLLWDLSRHPGASRAKGGN